MNILAKSSIRHFLRHPTQLILAVFGIALGVAVVLAIDLANASATRAFELSTESVVGRATHRITGGPEGIDEQLYARLRRELPLRPAAPQITGSAIAHVGDRNHPVTILGIDPLAEAPLRPWLAIAGELGELDLGSLMTRAGAVIMTASAAERCGLKVGDAFLVEANGFRTPVQLSALLSPRDDRVTRGLETILLADISTAQEVLRRIGRIDVIDVCLPPGPSGETALARLQTQLPPGLTMTTAGARRGVLRDLTRAFRINLQALSLLVLLVGGFLIFNAVQFAVVQRRAVFGTLRATGATRGQLFRVILAEAATLGATGTALGLVLGPWLASALVDLVARTINDLYFSLAVTDVAMPVGAFAKALALGLGVCTASALPSALEATRVPPREAMLRTSLEQRFRRALPRMLVWSGVCALAGAVILLASSRSLLMAYAGLFAVVLAAAFLVPIICVGLLRALRTPMRWAFGTAGAHAARGASASLSRTAIATAALMLAVAASVGLGSMITSFRHAVATWLGTVLQADVYITVPTGYSDRNTALIDPRLSTAIRTAPGVADSATYRRFSAPIVVRGADYPGVQLVALDTRPAILGAFSWVAGDPAQIGSEMAGPGSTMISEPLAYRLDLTVGDEFTVQTDRGWQALRVSAVFVDYGSERGVAMIDRTATYQRWWRDGGEVSSLAVFAAPAVSPDDLAEQLRGLAAGARQALSIQSNRSLRSASLEVFDRTFSITGALRALCMIVAFLGIWSALMALQLDRVREIGVLRALGALPRQIATMVLAQTGLLGLCAGLIALPLGAILGWLLVTVVNQRSFGWTLLEAHLPLTVAAEALALSVLAALLAGVYPAVRFARTPTVPALREEG